MVRNWYNVESEAVLLLLGREAHLRSIAKQLSLPHSTVRRKLEFLIKENVLDCRTEGKNKIFFIKKTLQARNYVFNAERHKLITLFQQNKDMDGIITGLLEQSNEKLIVLFGSYARFAAKPDSDIDIYILTKNKKAKQNLEALYTKIKVKFGPFDTSSPLIREIIKNHVILRGVEEFYDKLGFFG